MTEIRRLYIPKGAIKISDKQSDAVAYVHAVNGNLYAIAYSGKRFKPDWNFRFSTEKRRDERILQHFQSVRERAAYKTERKAAAKAVGRGLDVGDVLRCTWGYDQTNIDYYEVTALVGARMVEIRKIAAKTTETGWCCGTCVPMVGEYIGEPMRKVAKDGSVRIESYASAHKMKPTASVGNVRAYGSDSWTAYA